MLSYPPVVPSPPSHDELVDALQRQDPSAAAGDDAVLSLARAIAAVDEPDRRALKLACRATAQRLAAQVPGRTVELRVPPFAAVQCVAGPRHTRGTPPNVVEAQPLAWLRLVVGALTWADAVRDGRVRASGERSDLSAHLPFPELRG